MSIFDGKPIAMNPKIVLSASRMTDMPKFYPDKLMEEVDNRLARGLEIHTLVLWTKHPASLLIDPLRSYLEELKNKNIQLYVQLTITGLGGLSIGIKANGKPLVLEPKAPSLQDSLPALPDIIYLAGSPDRIRLRVDPIVRIKDSKGNTFSSLKFLPVIIKSAAQYGIKYFSFSFLEKNMHQKVDKRFREMGCQIVPPDEEERHRTFHWLKQVESAYGVFISACCVPGFPDSKCIDGELLQQLHDRQEPADSRQPRKRPQCGCTYSIDIGGWPPKLCYTGCDYCYAHANYID
ncbi:hypothetical protein Psch_02722 [Pelotomaculum schinkii]|uniref:DUF1848 family protein n=1 Tax=Pelotomaculum schinkii TaxID=78350 RepID=A0A4Y7RAI8_9FIRM|nr:DUF1848 family protein [Pelotomaculum schinkii]TEB05681.1 hypothetical protein Psch_02722 [Pelotomaculum schinkii]